MNKTPQKNKGKKKVNTSCTPRKPSTSICLVCGQESKTKIFISGDAGEKKQLPQLIELYGKVTLKDGAICRNCERRLLTLHQNATDFYTLCQKNCFAAKRCAPSPTGKSPTAKKSVAGNQKSDSTPRTCLNFDNILPIPPPETPDNVQPFPLIQPVPEHNITPLSRKQTCNITNFRPIKPLLLDNKDNEPHKPTAAQPSNSKKKEKDKGTTEQRNHVDIDHSYCAPIHSKEKISKPSPIVQLDHVSQKLKTLASVSKTGNSDLSQDTLTPVECGTLIQAIKIGSVRLVTKALMENSKISSHFMDCVSAKIRDTCAGMGNRKHNVSLFMKKDAEDLLNFNWEDLLDEMIVTVPGFVQTTLAVLLPGDATDAEIMQAKYRLVTSYAILLQGRNRELSLLQRMITILLQDHMCDQKVTL